MASKPLAGLSILVADDDVLGGFRTRTFLVKSGARVAAATAAEAVAYLASPHLKAVVVGTLFAGIEAAAFRQALARARTPWLAFGTGAAAEAERTVPAGDFPMLAAAVQALCGSQKH